MLFTLYNQNVIFHEMNSNFYQVYKKSRQNQKPDAVQYNICMYNIGNKNTSNTKISITISVRHIYSYLYKVTTDI